MTPLEPFIHTRRIAYFSMEMAIDQSIPTYSGGLGMLAGDTLRASVDLELPLVGVTLVSRLGYFRQQIDRDGRQSESPDPWQPEQCLTPLDAKIALPLENRRVWAQAWLYVLTGGTGSQLPVIMLDTDLPENSEEDRRITDHLYGGDDAYRLKQEVVLGIGGARILQALGFRISKYHMNEGHSALLGLELLWRFERSPDEVGPGESIYNAGRVREQCIFTTHTPLEAGHDQFDYSLAQRILDDFIDIHELKRLAGADKLNMTRLAMNLSGYVNGVAKSHAETSNHMFPGYHVRAITNGVHGPTWTCPSFAALYDRHLPAWRHQPEILVRADQIANDEILAAHRKAKLALLEKIEQTTGIVLDRGAPVIGFARRMTSYKRPDLLFSDIERLKNIAERYPLQIVYAGKAHPRDEAGKRMLEQIHTQMKALKGIIKTAFLPNYDMELGRAMVSGTDLWLNTPLRPLEASGTSGMKAAFNGVPQLSVLDGWWLEGVIEGVTGWAIGAASDDNLNDNDGADLYKKLETVVLPLFYNDQAGWLNIMKGAISKNAFYFNSHRMMRRYALEAYLR